jgi:hypothetical protein
MSLSKAAVVAVASTSLSILALTSHAASPEKPLTICGEDVKVLATNPLKVQGSFYIGPPHPPSCRASGQTKPGGSWPTIPSHETGGACLIADLNFKGIPASGSSKCTTDKQCTDAIPDKFTGTNNIYTDKNNNQKNRDWHGYCVAGTCWTRPGQQASHCLISKIQNKGEPWPTGSHPFGPPPVSPTVYTIADMYHELGIAGSVNWRVHACLNGSNGIFKGDNTDCSNVSGENVNRLIDDGPPHGVP